MTGALEAFPPQRVTAIVNVGDDIVMHGLSISPDLDTCTYTLAGAIDPGRGWGLVDESWQAMDVLGTYGGDNWFGLGDRDLGTHLYRTDRIAAGATLTQVTAEIAKRWDIECTLLPASDDPIRTMVELAGGSEVSFQEYFVKLSHNVEVCSVRFAGTDKARANPAGLDAIRDADSLVIAPSNPIVSIGPILAIPGIGDAISARRATNVAISPIIGGRALKGPADRMLAEMGEESSVVGIARRYRDLVGTLIIDETDADLADDVKDVGVEVVVVPTIMSEPGVACALARTAAAACGQSW